MLKIGQWFPWMRRWFTVQWTAESTRYLIAFCGGYGLFYALGSAHPTIGGISVLAIYIGTRE